MRNKYVLLILEMRLIILIVVLFALAHSTGAQYVPTWDPDADGDDVIGVYDLLALLGVFEEVDSDGDGIFDSLDNCVGGYDDCGVCNGNGEDADTDGLCDNVDPCVGEIDPCGVCNGPGPSVPVIDEIVYATDSVFLPPVGTWYVFSYAVDTLYTYVCPVSGCTDTQASNFNPLAVIEDGSCSFGPAQCNGQSTVTFDGHTYALLGIGTQCWFKENLRSGNYRNGDAIPGNLSSSSWQNTTSGAQTIYSNNAGNLTTYGRLYNWYATQDSRGLCPTGFHVPSDSEWMMLEMALGMTDLQSNAWGWRGIDQGTQMKSSLVDSPPWNGTNSSDFSGLPAGFRNSLSFYGSLGTMSIWWTATPNADYAFSRSLQSSEQKVNRSQGVLQSGFSVRCVQDSGGVFCFDPDLDGVCAENEISGCTITTALNFDPVATEDDDSCEFQGPAQCGGQAAVTFHDYTYSLIGIGTQCWFRENLRSFLYRNGDSIPGDLDDFEWSSTTIGAQTVYGEGASQLEGGSGDEVTNLSDYGILYNWYTVIDVRGLCPVGFHVPSDAEWRNLEMSLGMTQVQADSWGWRGTDQGTKMKASFDDVPPWVGSNLSGFSGLPGGYRGSDGNFYYQGSNGSWWSSFSLGSNAIYRSLVTENLDVNRGNDYNQKAGLSVRCIKD
jgi:uncharacterized protein (TIGR02145 family)